MTDRSGKPSGRMSDGDVMAHLRGETEFNALRRVFSGAYCSIVSEFEQRRPPSPVEVRRMEFEAVLKVLRHAGVGEEKLEALLRASEAAPAPVPARN